MSAWYERLLKSTHTHPISSIDDDGSVIEHSLSALTARVHELETALKVRSISDSRVSLFAPAGKDFVAALIAIWRTGNVAVPLATVLPQREIESVESTTDVVLRITIDKSGSVAFVERQPDTNATGYDDAALMLMTSGTTAAPKAVVVTHAQASAQIARLHDAWQINSDDHVLSFLPLHHVHGLMNVVLTTLTAGGRVTFLDKPTPTALYRAFLTRDFTVCMGVPTHYERLLKSDDDELARAATPRMRKLRLFISGSAALPTWAFDGFANRFGHTLLERYGMTEIGMALGNPLDGERVKGTVGFPLEGVECEIVDDGGERRRNIDGEGELLVRSTSVCAGYFRQAHATRAAFTDDGFFRTGDRVRREAGRFTILGRQNIDIIKTGGEKVSALEIERALVEILGFTTAIVVGVPDDTWGEAITVVFEGTSESAPTREHVRERLREHLAPFKLPQRVVVVDEIPRNALGKVQKSLLRASLHKSIRMETSK